MIKVTCISNEGYWSLTPGDIYQVMELEQFPEHYPIGGTGNLYPKVKFIDIKEERNKKL
jgi:hypothetical protein